jgi:Tryptophan-associated transmembrane protein (Trp_oprn_chp)
MSAAPAGAPRGLSEPADPPGRQAHPDGARHGLRGRRSLNLALLLLAVGAVAALTGAGRAWATVHATSEVPQLGVDWTASAGVAGNDVAPLNAFALLALVSSLGIAVTRGRGRWPAGVVLTALGLTVTGMAIEAVGRLRETALELAIAGRLEALPAAAALRVDTSPAGPSLAVAGGLLIAAAGLLTAWYGRGWPILGERYRAPGDRRSTGATDLGSGVHHDG